MRGLEYRGYGGAGQTFLLEIGRADTLVTKRRAQPSS
jgi:hypothetical protein